MRIKTWGGRNKYQKTQKRECEEGRECLWRAESRRVGEWLCPGARPAADPETNRAQWRGKAACHLTNCIRLCTPVPISMCAYLSGATDAYTCPNTPSLAGKLCTKWSVSEAKSWRLQDWQRQENQSAIFPVLSNRLLLYSLKACTIFLCAVWNQFVLWNRDFTFRLITYYWQNRFDLCGLPAQKLICASPLHCQSSS